MIPMYDELIERLRETSVDFGESDNVSVMMIETANAIEDLENRLNLWRQDKIRRWIPVTERLPENGVHVFLSCKCGAGAYVCDGFHTEKYSMPAQFYADIDADYDEETDEYYFPEGWWEVIKNWDDYSCVAIEDTITHWMPLPQPPKEG